MKELILLYKVYAEGLSSISTDGAIMNTLENIWD